MSLVLFPGSEQYYTDVKYLEYLEKITLVYRIIWILNWVYPENSQL